MADASYAFGNFTGGEISQFAQGRFDKPDYRTSLKTCLNGYPMEAGAWVRRPGTRYAGHTRRGAPGRVIKFDFQQSAPITLEFSDGYLRFRNGATLITTNDVQVVVAVSAANPAVVETASDTDWATGDTLIFPAASTPLLENRQFVATAIDTTHFSLADAITGASIDGSTLGALVAGATVARVEELTTAYVGTSWSGIRAVQAETTDILLSATVAPQALTVTTPPSTGVDPQFALNPATFNDGPYLDLFTNGVQATPADVSVGIVSILLSFAAYSASVAYAAGVFVTSGGVNYVSLSDQNVGNSPATSPAFWAPTTAGAAINNGRGFLGSDIGRMARFLSEPLPWSVATAYSTGAVVAYNPSGAPGATTYWQAQAPSTATPPGTNLTYWSLMPQGAALWTWGKIVSLSNAIDRALPGSVNIGDMTSTSGGGLAAAFDGVFTKASALCAENIGSGAFVSPSQIVSFSSYIGKNYSGASNQQIQQVTIFPSSDNGIGFGNYAPLTGGSLGLTTTTTLNLRAKSSPPLSPSDGTLLGTSGPILDTASGITIISSDQTTSWAYVWVEIFVQAPVGTFGASSWSLVSAVAQAVFFNPAGTGTSAGFNVEILGPKLLYANPVLTWRLGVYSNTTGWPTCGVYNDGRLYLGGAVGNRFDACVANGMQGGTINFAPTDQYGAVSAASAISYTFNSDGVNPILWMIPDLQGVLMGTQAGEWLVQAPTAGSISPTNITARNVTKHGGTSIPPCRTEHTTIFVQRFAKKLMEYFPDVFSGKFSAPNLADKAQHIVRAGVAELAYTSAVNPIIWGRDNLGALFGITYKRDSLASSQPPTFYGWHRHTLGSGRVVESICSGPSTGGDLDALTMVTNDSATGIRHVEVLTDTPDELSTLAQAWFLDDAMQSTSTVSSATSLTINGLWPLNGKTVQVFAGGLDCGDRGDATPALVDFVVSNGSVIVPYGDGITAGPGRGLFTEAFVATNPQIVVGFTYTSDGQTVRPIAQADSGARTGPAFGKLSRGHRYALKLVNALGLSVGGTFAKMRPANFKQSNNAALPALTTFTGISQDTLEDDYDYDRGLCWRVTRPFPANVVVAGANLQTQDQ